MARYDVCGNEYDKLMTIEAWGRRHAFDCFVRSTSWRPFATTVDVA
jgi:hypothetical protein